MNEPVQEYNKKYTSPVEALDELQQAFNAWCEMLTNHSLQAAYAIIAANWAVHGKTAILTNSCSKWSMALILGFLGANLLVDWLISEFSYSEYSSAEDDRMRWKKEWEEYEKGDKHNKYWPYTGKTQVLPRIHRFLKCWVPFIAAFLFICSLFG
jgi:hypothetical protein